MILAGTASQCHYDVGPSHRKFWPKSCGFWPPSALHCHLCCVMPAVEAISMLRSLGGRISCRLSEFRNILKSFGFFKISKFRQLTGFRPPEAKILRILTDLPLAVVNLCRIDDSQRLLRPSIAFGLAATRKSFAFFLKAALGHLGYLRALLCHFSYAKWHSDEQNALTRILRAHFLRKCAPARR